MRYRIFRWFFKYTGLFLSLFERLYLNRYGGTHTDYPLVFIIGAPRSGSTILYQLITSFLNVAYINNLMNAARVNVNVGFSLSHFFFKDKGHNSFRSDYGRTVKQGLNAPAEGVFWNKWLPVDHHYLTRTDIKEDDKQKIKERLNSLVNRAHKPLVIKNLAFSVRLDLLHELYPHAYFIFVTRDKVSHTLSILRARRNNNIPPDKIWSIKPENYRDLEKEEDEIMMVVKQIFSIEKQIEKDLQFFAKDHVILVKYEDLLKDYEGIVQHIAGKLNLTLRENYPKLPELASKPIETDPALLEKLQYCISQFKW